MNFFGMVGFLEPLAPFFWLSFTHKKKKHKSFHYMRYGTFNKNSFEIVLLNMRFVEITFSIFPLLSFQTALLTMFFAKDFSAFFLFYIAKREIGFLITETLINLKISLYETKLNIRLRNNLRSNLTRYIEINERACESSLYNEVRL